MVDLADAIAGALLADAPRQAGVLAAIRSMLATLASQAAVRLVVATVDAPSVRAVLAELAADCGFKGDIELVADPRLTAGDRPAAVAGWLASSMRPKPFATRSTQSWRRIALPNPVRACRARARPAATSTGDDHALA